MVIIEGEGAVLGGESLGLSIVTSGIVCVRGGDAALPKLLWNFLASRGNLCDSTAFLFHTALVITFLTVAMS